MQLHSHTCHLFRPFVAAVDVPVPTSTSDRRRGRAADNDPIDAPPAKKIATSCDHQSSLNNFFSSRTASYKNGQLVKEVLAPPDPNAAFITGDDNDASNNNEKSHECPFCGDSFKSIQGLTSHKNYRHKHSAAKDRRIRFGPSSSSSPASSPAQSATDSDLSPHEVMAIDSPHVHDESTDAEESESQVRPIHKFKTRRQGYDVSTKLSVILEYEEAKADWWEKEKRILQQKQFIRLARLKINPSMLCRWIKKKKDYSEITKRKITKEMKALNVKKMGSRSAGRFELEEKEVVTRIKARRAKNLAVSTRWVIHQMKKVMLAKRYGEYYSVCCAFYRYTRIHLTSVPLFNAPSFATTVEATADSPGHWDSPQAESFTATKMWLSKFMKRHKFTKKKRNNKRTKTIDEVRTRCQRFHSSFRHMLRTHGGYEFVAGDATCKYGCFPPECRWAVDQVPLPLVLGLDSTWADEGSGPVCVSQPSSSSDKRFCTIQVLFRQRGEQPDIAVIFRGTGKKIPQAEKDMYADGVKVYWQKKVSRL